MIGPLLLERLRAIYKSYLDADDFRPSFMPRFDDEGLPDFYRFRHFLLSLLPSAEIPSDLGMKPIVPSVDMLFADFLNLRHTLNDGTGIDMSTLVLSIFCVQATASVIRDAFIFPVSDDTERDKLIAESGYSSLVELIQSMTDDENRAQITDQFREDLFAAWSARPLRSFFVGAENEYGYLTWWPGAKTGIGRPLPVKEFPLPDFGVVRCEVARYEQDDDEPVVRAYEWNAELRSEQSAEVPDAVAYGMAYVFDRDETGRPYGGIDDLVAAADNVADTDVNQISAFFDQHEDAWELLVESDVCFVWLWERRKDAIEGAGAACLLAAVADLKRRFRKIRVVVVDLKPAQFISWTDELDYPEIELAKQEAIDSVHEYLQQLGLSSIVKGEVRPILNNCESDSDAALTVVTEGVPNSREIYDDDDDDDDDESDGPPFKMVCGLWLTPDFSQVNNGKRPPPRVDHSAIDFGALHAAIESLFPYGPQVDIQIGNDTVDLVTVETRGRAMNVDNDFKYCRDFARALLRLASADTSPVLDIQPAWERLHFLPNRMAAPPPVLIAFVVTADDFADAMIWQSSAGISFGIAPMNPFEEDEYDPSGKLPARFREYLEALFGCSFEERCVFERICSDQPPAKFGLG